MSIYTFIWSALRNPDPYDACFWGASEHPHYHDCKNCTHIADKTCEYGSSQTTLKELQSAIVEGKTMLDSYPKLKPNRLP